MKKVIVSLLAAVVIVSCNQDDTPVEMTGRVSFVVNGSGLDAGRTGGLTPEQVLVSVEDKEGKTIIDNKLFCLESSESGYATEKISLQKGDYRVTKYLVISGTTAAYATPRSGAEKATLIDKPLPFDFTVESSDNSVAPTIIGISSEDVPQNFGYSDFGYHTPDSPEEQVLNIRFKLEMILGGIYYQNVDATFTVKGFDENNVNQWGQNFEYTGPEQNDFKIKDGFHHYTVETRKWGKTLSQMYTRRSLWDGRVREGVVPLTHVFQAQVEPKKVASTITSWSQVVNGQTVMMPVNKATYEYQNGRVAIIRYSTWSEEQSKYIEDYRSEFSYEGTLVKKIINYQAGTNAFYEQDVYTYDANGNTTHIQHKGEGLTAEVDLVHQLNDRMVNVTYRFSNGAGFEYEFVNEYGSMKSDKTTRGSQLCSEATYTSDKNINPLKHLGYTDYLLRNYSISNRVTESANYIACAFPSLNAESYDYVYDEDGYPLRATTNFKGTDSHTEIVYNYLY